MCWGMTVTVRGHALESVRGAGHASNLAPGSGYAGCTLQHDIVSVHTGTQVCVRSSGAV
jgi:hypothetical protein